jgi:FtsH-binding integral membrane protein
MMNSETYTSSNVVAETTPQLRAAFIRRTYGHLAGAILAFVAIEVFLFKFTPLPEAILNLLSQSRYSWLIVMVAFMGVSWVADKWAQSDTSVGMQYTGLGLYVVVQALIFVPLLLVAARVAGDSVILLAAIITGLLFAGLTFTAFTTRTDFSFLGGILKMLSFVALGIIGCSIVFGFTLGLIFSSVMVLFAGGAILYTTSNIMHHYRPHQHVAASLALFAAVALLFWYVLRILMSMGRRD